jgi:hypothetical protein
VQVERFMTAQAMMLALVGMPGIYFHSLFGSRGWPEGAAQSGQKRTINRQKLGLAELEAELERPGSLRREVFGRYAALLRVRAGRAAFDPYGTMAVLEAGPAVFGVRRGAGREAVLCLHNVSASAQPIPAAVLEGLAPGRRVDLISGKPMPDVLGPYGTAWLAAL